MASSAQTARQLGNEASQTLSHLCRFPLYDSASFLAPSLPRKFGCVSSKPPPTDWPPPAKLACAAASTKDSLDKPQSPNTVNPQPPPVFLVAFTTTFVPPFSPTCYLILSPYFHACPSANNPGLPVPPGDFAANVPHFTHLPPPAEPTTWLRNSARRLGHLFRFPRASARTLERSRVSGCQLSTHSRLWPSIYSPCLHASRCLIAAHATPGFQARFHDVRRRRGNSRRVWRGSLGRLPSRRAHARRRELPRPSCCEEALHGLWCWPC